MNKQTKICYILAYYFPQYVRTKVLVDGLKGLKNTAVYTAINENTSFGRYFETIFKLIKIRLKYNPDVYILGFRGYEYFWVIKLLTLGKPLIYDHMMSPHDSLVHEKKSVRKGGLLDKLIWIYERSILKSANKVLTDSTIHSHFFASHFNIPKAHFFNIPVSTDEEMFFPKGQNSGNDKRPFTILFYGSFLPLHGVPLILSAAKMVADLPVVFDMIGGNRINLDWFFEQIKIENLKNVHHTSWIPYSDLPNRIAQADLCIGGPLGNTGQSSRIITGKSYQFLAMGKPTIIGDVRMTHPFRHKENCLLIPQGDKVALAEAIRWAVSNQDRLPQLGDAGRALFETHFSLNYIQHRLSHLLKEFIL